MVVGGDKLMERYMYSSQAQRACFEDDDGWGMRLAAANERLYRLGPEEVKISSDLGRASADFLLSFLTTTV